MKTEVALRLPSNSKAPVLMISSDFSDQHPDFDSKITQILEDLDSDFGWSLSAYNGVQSAWYGNAGQTQGGSLKIKAGSDKIMPVVHERNPP